MRRGDPEPAVGAEVDVLETLSPASNIALVRARVVLQQMRRGKTEAVERPFLLTDEADAWEVNLWDVVDLASYFPPEYRPIPPPSGPYGTSS